MVYRFWGQKNRRDNTIIFILHLISHPKSFFHATLPKKLTTPPRHKKILTQVFSQPKFTKISYLYAMQNGVRQTYL